MKEVYDNGEKLAEYRHTPGGMLLSQRHGPLQVSYGYDRDKNLTALKALSGDEILADNLYEYDGNGNRTKKRQMEGETQYIYDGLNQLTKIEYPTLTEELFYDKAGNRTRRIAGDEEDLYSYDPRNRLMSHTRGGVTTPLVYDDAGNLLRNGRAIYEYDGFNRAVKAETFDGNIQVNRYDAEGLRYELEENGRLVQFIFHQSEVITEQNETDTIRLIRGYDLIASDAQSARTYYHYASDELGSTTHIIDEKGKVLNRYAYDAFGNITEQEETVPNRFKFNGQQFDPITQQYYLRARFYNPVVARFTQEDVYRGDGLNLYAYCHNNPVIYEDPDGYGAGLCPSAQERIGAALENKDFGQATPLEQMKYAEVLRQKQAKGTITPAELTQLQNYAAHRNEIMTRQLAIVESARARDPNPANWGRNAQHAAELLIRNASQGGIMDSSGSIIGGMRGTLWGDGQRIYFGIAPDGTTLLAGNRKPNSASQYVATQIFGDITVLPGGKRSSFQHVIPGANNGGHGEMRILQGFLNLDEGYAGGKVSDAYITEVLRQITIGGGFYSCNECADTFEYYTLPFTISGNARDHGGIELFEDQRSK